MDEEMLKEVEDNAESGNDEVVENGHTNGLDMEQMLEGNKKQVFILSSAGKPVYSWRGCEDKLVTLFGVMQALVSVVQDGDDTIQAINAGQTTIVFLVRGPILLVSVNPGGESIKFLSNQLTYVYNQVVSVLTLTKVVRIFEERHNYDLRRLLAGSERLIDHLISFTENRPEFLFDSTSCLYMPQSARNSIGSAIITSCSKIKNLVFALLVGNDRIISIVRMKKYKLKPCDIHLICNLVSSSESFKTAESWTPICLPDFNPSGYLHAHVSYISENVPACLLLLTVEPDTFFPLSDAKKQIESKLDSNQCNIVLREYLDRPVFSMTQIGVPYIRHFVYKCMATSQIFYPQWPENPIEAEKLLKQYEFVKSRMDRNCCKLKLQYQMLQNQIMFGWRTEKFELYTIYEPMVSKAVVTESINKLLVWIGHEEEKLFMQNMLQF